MRRFKTETPYRNYLAKKIEEELLPGSIVLVNDPSHRQGIPDLTVFFGPCWATLEVKISEHADVQPNQPHYVERMDEMSFSRFIWPEIEDEVLNDLQRALTTRRAPLVSQS